MHVNYLMLWRVSAGGVLRIYSEVDPAFSWSLALTYLSRSLQKQTYGSFLVISFVIVI
jgi:hypothetical protein